MLVDEKVELSSEGRKLRIGVFDIETNGFFEDVHTVWCFWVQDPISGNKVGYRPHEIEKGLRFLETFDVLVGHNIVDYDIPVLKKLYPWWKPKGAFDTLTLSRMLDPDRKIHSLKSYGKQLDNEKGDYGEEEEAWDAFTEDMYVYCEQDVNLNVDIYHKLCQRAGFDPENPPFIEGHRL
ncbi:DNA polymerase [Vibrio phage Vp_R1]|uniref:DNA polymerase n=1 Tax=Vibrio phage Vp_R1 TaxID=2059867 RepID=A0A2H5BQ08_9CAUD|nr:DNA polymerase [Vibrio phage Vp_R1]AUG88414.1 DNA polymerase [Vibrio phage Vp_R1]